MTYFIVFLILLVFSLMEYASQREQTRRVLFCLSGTLFLLFCSLRYGVASDYFAYEYIYDVLPDSFTQDYDLSSIHGEYLFLRYFMYFKSIGIEYIYVSLITVLTSCLLLLRFISKYSPYRCFSILILYSWYFVYVFSALRQGLALGIILGIGIPWLLRGQYWKYALVVGVTTLIHSSSLLCILFILPHKFKFFDKFDKYYPTFVAVCIPFIVIPNPLISQLTEVTEKGVYDTNKLSIGAILNRMLSCGIIYLFAKPLDKTYQTLKRIYLMGFMVYLVLAQSELIASRLNVYFKIFDIVLIPLILLLLPRKYYLLFIIAFSIYFAFMYMNHIGYLADVTNTFGGAWAYPYFTIFEVNEFKHGIR